MDKPKLIKSGAFGSVYLIKEKNEKLAVKVFDMSKSGKQTLEEAVTEARILEKMEHGNITKYFGSHNMGKEFRVFMEYCDGGDLETFIESKRRKKCFIEEDLILKWMFETCSALQYIHSINLLHRDLKPANILLTGKDLTAKIGDFGVSKLLDSPDATTKTFAGTAYYMSPEIHKRQRYGQKTDIWSLGCCYYELVTLKPVFGGLAFSQLVTKIVDGKIPDFPHRKYDEAIYDVILKMMNKNPTKRPSGADILDTALFKKQSYETTPSRHDDVHEGDDIDIVKLSDFLSASLKSTGSEREGFNPIDPGKIKDTFDLIDPERLAAARSVKSTLKRTEITNIDKKKHQKKEKDAEKSFSFDDKSTSSSSGISAWSTSDTLTLLSRSRQSLLSSLSSYSDSSSSSDTLSSSLKELTREMERLITSTLDTDMSTIRSVMSTSDMTTLTEKILSSSDAFQQAVLYDLIFLWMSMTSA